jgi:hypothetical protein
MNLVIELINGPFDGGFLSFPISMEVASQLATIEQDNNIYNVYDIDLVNSTAKAKWKKYNTEQNKHQ